MMDIYSREVGFKCSSEAFNKFRYDTFCYACDNIYTSTLQ